MKTWLIRRAIVAAILAQLYWSLLTPRNNLMPRSEQTLAAIHEYQANSTPENKATMLQLMHQDIARNRSRGGLQFGLMLLADIVVIYFFWNYGVKKNATEPGTGASAYYAS